MKRIEIGVGSLRSALTQFVEVWRRVEAGEKLPVAKPRVDFGSLSELLGALTPKRLELLDAIGTQSGSSVRGLATRLGRDYKNVHGDVAALEQLGLIERTADGTLSAPYDELVIHAPLKMPKKAA